MQKNGTLWKDTDGAGIQAHGGCILFHNGTYYWYGENKNAVTVKRRMDFIGFSCYTSKNLVDWKNEGLVFKAFKEPANHEAGIKCIGERPKVVYSKKLKKFVLWFHLDNMTYELRRAAWAISDSPVGPFEYMGSFKPNIRDCCDFTVFIDNDEKAYFICAGDMNKTMLIHEMDDTYTKFTGAYKAIFTEQAREAPVFYHVGDWYYSATSGCTGYSPNAMLYGTSEHIFGRWRLWDNPCMGRADYRKTFQGQSCNSLFANGRWYMMLDHWNPEDIRVSGYSILPVNFDGGYMEVLWEDEWNGIK